MATSWKIPEMDLRLESMAAVAFTASFIDHPCVQNIFQNQIQKSKFGEVQDSDTINLVQEFIRKELEKNLPKRISSEILYRSDSILEKYIKWQEMMKTLFSINYVNLGRFYWTGYGTVDTAKIVEKEWTSWFDTRGSYKKKFIEKFGLPKCEFKARFALYYMSCACVLSDYIEANRHEILTFCEECSKAESVSAIKIQYIVYSVAFFIGREKWKIEKFRTTGFVFFDHIFKDVKTLRKKNNLAEYMFSLCVHQGCDVAARYYWGLLDHNKINKMCIVQSALKSYILYNSTLQISYRNITIFLIMHMSSSQVTHFISEREVVGSVSKPYKKFFDIIMDNWPWDEIFFPVFDVVKVRLLSSADIISDCYVLLRNSLLGKLAEKMTHVKNDFGYDHKKTIYYRMFFSVFQQRKEEGHLIPTYTDGSEFLELFDLSILKLIRESECQGEDCRRRFVKPSYWNVFGRLVRENRFEELDEFIEVVLATDDEKKWFKRNLDWYSDFMTNCDFQPLDNLLIWQFETEEERRSRKYHAIVRVDLLNVCGTFFAKNRLDLAEKAKKWLFSDEQIRKKYINDYETDNSQWLNLIWRTCFAENYKLQIEKAKRVTGKFLKWFLETEEEVAKFKKEKLISKNIIRNFLLFQESKNLKYISPCKVLAHLLVFSLSAEDILQLKQNLIANFSDWLLFFSSGKYLRYYINDFANFIFDDEMKKQIEIRKFLLSENRHRFFFNIITPEVEKSLLKTVGLWIKFSVGADGIGEYITEINPNFRDSQYATKLDYLMFSASVTDI